MLANLKQNRMLHLDSSRESIKIPYCRGSTLEAYVNMQEFINLFNLINRTFCLAGLLIYSLMHYLTIDILLRYMKKLDYSHSELLLYINWNM